VYFGIRPKWIKYKYKKWIKYEYKIVIKNYYNVRILNLRLVQICCSQHLTLTAKVKPGFHYPSWRPELTARVDGRPVTITRQHGPLTRAVNSGSGNRAYKYTRYIVCPVSHLSNYSYFVFDVIFSVVFGRIRIHYSACYSDRIQYE